MYASPTLTLYLGRQFLIGISFVLCTLILLVFFIDLVEHLRRTSGRETVSLAVVLTMTILNLPSLIQKLLPFAALFGAMFTFSKLTRSNELIVARAAGVSVWQFLAPGLIIAALIGGAVVTLFNPLGAVMTAKYEQLEGKYMEGRTNLLAMSSTGLWLRQVDDTGQSVVHAQNVSSAGVELQQVIIFLYRGSDKFIGRIDCETARLEPGYWVLTNALVTRPEGPTERHESFILDTTLTLEQIQESFASPETLSFWSLPRFIATLEKAGFSATRHRLHWHAILATPLLLCAMVLIAATFTLRITRHGHTGLLIAVGATLAFLLYFISDVVYALGMAGNLPTVLAAWTPAGVATFLGIATLLHLEDG